MKCKFLLLFFLSSLSLVVKEVYPSYILSYNDYTSKNDWWDVLHYRINIAPDLLKKEISGNVEILFRAKKSGYKLELNLKQPLIVDSVFEKIYYRGENNFKLIRLKFIRTDDIINVSFRSSVLNKHTKIIVIFYKGRPQEANNPPWGDGGVIWKTDSLGFPFVSVACQKTGAFVWMPCKNTVNDEPDRGMTLSINCNSSLKCISNGKLLNVFDNGNLTKTWTWNVINTINIYNINFTIGNLQNLKYTYNGLKGHLNIDFWVLSYNVVKAQKHFVIVNNILQIFEKWFGPYPFYEDGYKIIETPFLGMEHQSGIAYGNNYRNGYGGVDLSGTGCGLKWDFILVHESAHEWFGNSISVGNVSDLWIHESFASYAEVIFTEEFLNEKSANEYCYGIRKKIANNTPIVGSNNLDINHDIYYKGANIIHTFRNSIYDDKKFRKIIKDINKNFYHKIVSTQEMEKFLIKSSNYNYAPVFNQYLRTVDIPVLEYYFKRNNIFLRWSNCVKDFNLPIVMLQGKRYTKLYPTTRWQKFLIKKITKKWIVGKEIEKYFFIRLNKIH